MSFSEEQTWKGTKFERNATKCFAIIAILAIFTFAASFFSVEKNNLLQTDNPNFVSIQENTIQPIAAASFRGDKSKTESTSLSEFDPNTATKGELIRLGLSSKLAQTILNFRAKKGKFYQPSDLKKIYGFRANDYERLKDYVQIGSPNKPVTTTEKKAENNREKAVVQLFEFNPNDATKEELIQLGLSPKIAKRIINYRSKGGKFKKKEDLKRIYDFLETDYERLEQYIVLSIVDKTKKVTEEKSQKEIASFEEPSQPEIKIDINQSTAEDWQKLRGIGPKYATKILSFREKLGGFSSIEQVGTTYYFPDSVFQKVKSYLVASAIVNKLNINQVSKDDLQKHPYVSWKQAKGLIAYRAQHGEFKDIEGLKKIHGLFTEKDWNRLAPYLAF